MCGKSVGIIWFHYFSCHPSCGYNERWHDCPVRDKSDLKTLHAKMTGNNCERSSTIRNRQLTARFVRVFMRLPSWRRYALAEIIRSVVSVESCSGKSSTPEFTKTLSVWWRIPYIREESACVLPQHIPRKNIERMSMRLIVFLFWQTACYLFPPSFFWRKYLWDFLFVLYHMKNPRLFYRKKVSQTIENIFFHEKQLFLVF